MMLYSCKHNIKQWAFSLTELSIAMTIIAVVAGSALSVALTGDEYAKKTQTESKLDRIEEALAAYLANNKRLPCPADGTLLITNASFGVEGTPSSASCGSANFSSAKVYAGVVPVTTLSLPDDFMFDGWGRRITYAVDYRFANNSTTNTDCDGATSTVCFIDTSGDAATIKVHDASGTARTSTAVYVLISHGENGHGAFVKNGSSTRINTYISGNPWRSGGFDDELENAHFDNSGSNTAYNTTFVDKQFVRDEDGYTDYFDDMVRFKTKSELVKEAGTNLTSNILYDSICRDAEDIIENPTNACTGANSESDCTNFATEINSRCL